MRTCLVAACAAACGAIGCAAPSRERAADAADPRATVMAAVGWTPLHLAAAEGRSREVEALLAQGSSPDAHEGQGATPLHLACGKRSNDATVKALLARKADVRAVDVYGATPLHWAATHGRPGAARLLLQAGADVNARAGQQAFTALHAAAASGDLESVQLLLGSGADVSARDGGGLTPLAVAELSEHAAVAERLRQAGAGR